MTRLPQCGRMTGSQAIRKLVRKEPVRPFMALGLNLKFQIQLLKF
jgi:hypothetical protein